MNTDQTNDQNKRMSDTTVSVRLYPPQRKALKRLQEHRQDINSRSEAIRKAIETIDGGASVADDGGPQDFHTPTDPQKEAIYRAAVKLAGGPQQSSLWLREENLTGLAQAINNDQSIPISPDTDEMRGHLLSLGMRHVRPKNAPAENEVHRRYHLRHPTVDPSDINIDRGSQRDGTAPTNPGGSD